MTIEDNLPIWEANLGQLSAEEKWSGFIAGTKEVLTEGEKLGVDVIGELTDVLNGVARVAFGEAEYEEVQQKLTRIRELMEDRDVESQMPFFGIKVTKVDEAVDFIFAD